MSAVDQRTPHQVEVDRRVKSRVIQGIALLEETYGPDWADKIDLETLDLASNECCVLGQIGGSFVDVAEGLWGDAFGPQASARGFFIDSELKDRLVADEVIDDYGYYAYLTEVWRQEISGIKAGNRP